MRADAGQTTRRGGRERPLPRRPVRTGRKETGARQAFGPMNETEKDFTGRKP
jgi:hypothetical protein